MWSRDKLHINLGKMQGVLWVPVCQMPFSTATTGRGAAYISFFWTFLLKIAFVSRLSSTGKTHHNRLFLCEHTLNRYLQIKSRNTTIYYPAPLKVIKHRNVCHLNFLSCQHPTAVYCVLCLHLLLMAVKTMSKQ